MNSHLKKLRDQRGSTIVEVMASALLMVIIATSVFAALESSGRASAQERHRARAYAIAQEDQARLRSLRVNQVTRINQTRTVVQDGITYTVVSTGTPKLDRTTTTSCESGNNPSDYIAISSTVTWTSIGSRPAVVVESLIAPPNGSLEADRGTLGVSVVNGSGAPYSGITVNGSGAQSFSGVTEATGCVLFGDLPAGNYNVTAAAANLVDKDGVAPGPVPTSVVGQSSNTLSLQYDRPGAFTVGFRRINTGTTTANYTFLAMNYDRVRVTNPGMTQTRSFGTAGTNVTLLKPGTLFPFSSPYGVYAGACDANLPTAGAALGSYTVPAGQTAPAGANFTLQLPSLNLTAFQGTAASGTGSSGAVIKVTDEDCPAAGTREFRTTSAGKISEIATPSTAAYPGLPYGEYDICVSGPSTSGTRKLTFDSIDLFNPAAPTVVTAALRNGVTGTC